MAKIEKKHDVEKFFRTFANSNKQPNGKTTHQNTCCTSSKNRE